MRQLGGEIVCKSEWKKGSKFVFIVALQPQDLDEVMEQVNTRALNPNQLRNFPRINIKEELKLHENQLSKSDSDSLEIAEQIQE